MNDKNSLEELLVYTGHLLHRYHRMKGFDEERRMDPVRGQGRILLLLQKSEPMTQKELGFLLDIRPQSLGELVGKLERAGYLTREPNPEDRRSVLIRLTEKGRALSPDQGAEAHLFDCLDAAEQKMMTICLERIDDSLEKAIAALPVPPERPHRPGPGDFPPPPPGMHGPGGFPPPPSHFGPGDFPPPRGLRRDGIRVGGHPEGNDLPPELPEVPRDKTFNA